MPTTANPCTPARTFPDLMIDIEALAETPDAAPAEIALVFFDRDDPKREFQTFRYDPCPLDAIRLGFNVTPATLRWWADHEKPILIESGAPLADVLDEIAHDLATFITPTTRVWSRGNDYDLAILKLAYHRTGKPLPWPFYRARDVRTWLEGCDFKSPRKNDHNALTDATNQALDVIEATAKITTRETADKPAPEKPAKPGAEPLPEAIRAMAEALRRKCSRQADERARPNLSPLEHAIPLPAGIICSRAAADPRVGKNCGRVIAIVIPRA